MPAPRVVVRWMDGENGPFETTVEAGELKEFKAYHAGYIEPPVVKSVPKPKSSSKGKFNSPFKGEHLG